MSIYFGNDTVNDLYVGLTPVTKGYVGTHLFYNGDNTIIDLTYEKYILNTQYSTLYNTAEKPVKSAILKGNTLKEITNNLFDGEVEDGGYEIGTGEKRDYSNRKRCANKIEINPSTTYTLSGITWYLQYDENGDYLGYAGGNDKRLVFTSKNNARYLTFYNVNNESDFFVGLGDTEPLYELVSVKMPVLTTTGKNLWNEKDWGKGLTSSTGVVQIGGAYNGFRYNNELISVNGYDKIYCRTFAELDGVSSNSCRIAEYDLKKTFLRMIFSNPPYYTPSNDCKYIRVHFDLRYNPNATVPTDDIPTYGVVATEPITSYEPYKSNILTVNEEVELRAIGDVKDELNLLTGELTQRIGEIVLDGTQEYGISSSANGENTYFTQIPINNIVPGSTAISSAFPTVTKNLYLPENDFEGIRVTSNGDLQMKILKSKLTSLDSKGFIDYFKNNPLKVLFQQNEQSVKTVDLSIVDQDGNNTKLSTFDDLTHVTLSSEGFIPVAELEVTTKNEEVLSTLSLEMDDISETQTTLEKTSNTQSENVDATMIATTEIYEQIL